MGRGLRLLRQPPRGGRCGAWTTDVVSDQCSAGHGEWTSIRADDVVHILFARPSFPDGGALEHATSVDPVFDGVDQDCDGIADE